MNSRIAAPEGRRSVRAFRQRPLVYGAMATYAVASIALMATRQVGLTSEHAILLLLVGFAAIGRARPFVWDWLPFLFVAVMFEDLPGSAPRSPAASTSSPRSSSRRASSAGWCGTAWLQDHLDVGSSARSSGRGSPASTSSTSPPRSSLGSGCGSAAPDRFGTFVGAYVMVMAAGFVVYLLYPEMPPWLAARNGDLPPVHRIVVEILQKLGSFGNFYAGADPEPNAAMPSLHVAVPMVIACAVVAVRGVRRPTSWLWMLYPADDLGFGVIYLGEHYVAD